MRDIEAANWQLGESSRFSLVLVSALALLTISGPAVAASSGSIQPDSDSADSSEAIARAELVEATVTSSSHTSHPEAAIRKHAGSHKNRVPHFGAAAATINPVGEEEAHQNLGGEAFLEWNVAPGWLAIEFNLGGMVAKESVQLVLNLIYKKPFNVSSWLDPYVGIGPVFAPSLVDEHVNFSYGVGGAVVAGTHLWLSSSFGLVTELKYNLLYQRHDESPSLAQELGGCVGFVIAR